MTIKRKVDGSAAKLPPETPRTLRFSPGYLDRFDRSGPVVVYEVAIPAGIHLFWFVLWFV